MKEKKVIEEYFGDEFVYWNGYTIYKSFMEEQKYKYIVIDGKKYQRIKFGDEVKYLQGDQYPGYYEIACHDCDAVTGLYHAFGCDVEICPKCHKQLLSCCCTPLISNHELAMKYLRTK
jgi:hypothetical protein